MKKLSFGFIVIAFVFFSSVVYATKNETSTENVGQANSQSRDEASSSQEQPRTETVSPTGRPVQNNNEVQTQNQGDDSQIQTNTQERESSKEGEAVQQNEAVKTEAPRSATAEQHMSVVSQKVEELLTSQAIQGGVGEQIRQIAREQNSAQQKIQTELTKIDNRSGWLKALIGSDYQAIKNTQVVMEQNRLRIQQLEKLQSQLAGQSEISAVQAAIKALSEENTALQDKIDLENRANGIFGWLFKLFAKQ
ncbi:hypothetical protein M1523_03380 [Patescibacteria group bacterium]|nr:hypothetical protein [Patescibacteria group bacterium]MCL5091236.1 hypothetical protein [Patescibacteria group bacterium]